MTRPRLSSSGPPELPGLIGASVWMTLSIWKPLGARISRPRPETMPAVAVRSRPSGLPIAMAVSPTFDLVGVGERQRVQPARGGRVDVQDGDVDDGSLPSDVGGDRSAGVAEADLHLLVVADDVRVGDDRPVAVDDEAGAGPVAGLDRDDALARGRVDGADGAVGGRRGGRTLGRGRQRGRHGRVGVARRVVVAAHEPAAEQDGGDDHGGDRTTGECGQDGRAGLLRGPASGRRALVDEGRLVVRPQGAGGDGRALGRLTPAIAPVAGPEVVRIGHGRRLSNVGGVNMCALMV